MIHRRNRKIYPVSCIRVSYTPEEFYERYKLFGLCRYDKLDQVPPLDEEIDRLLWESGIEKSTPKITVDNGNKSNYLVGEEVVISVFGETGDTVELFRNGEMIKRLPVGARAIIPMELERGYYVAKLEGAGESVEFCVNQAEVSHEVCGNMITVCADPCDDQSKILYADFRQKGERDASLEKYEEITDEEKESGRYSRRIPQGGENFKVYYQNPYGVWTHRMSTSKDLVHFEHLGEIDYGEDNYPIQLYTNQVVKYYRAKDMFIGVPTRYIDRWKELEKFRQMPLLEFHEIRRKYHGREGTVVTDCSMITSRDGYHFKKWDEAFLTPGIEAAGNWFYGDCYTLYGLYETESDIEGAPNEISFISNNADRLRGTDFYRYMIRLDGFFSLYAKFRGGEILTKPFTFKGNELEINFSSSALGDIVITVCDENGKEIEGYKSIKMFGDSVKRIVKFERDLKDLEGKAIRLKIHLRDANLYSFKFN